jgi:hypothetical protein
MATNQLSSFGGGSAAVQSDDLLAFDPRVSRAGATVGDWNQSQYATSTFGVGFDDRAAASARNSDLSSLGMQPGRGLQFASQDEGIVSNGGTLIFLSSKFDVKTPLAFRLALSFVSHKSFSLIRTRLLRSPI